MQKDDDPELKVELGTEQSRMLNLCVNGTAPIKFVCVISVPCVAVSYDQLEAMKHEYFSSKKPSGNPFTAKNIIDYNM